MSELLKLLKQSLDPVFLDLLDGTHCDKVMKIMTNLELASRLRKATDERDLETGYALLAQHAVHPEFHVLKSSSDIELLYELSRWLTTWPPLQTILPSVANHSPVTGATTLRDFALLKLARAFIALADRKLDVVDECAGQVLSVGDGIESYLLAGAHFCRGRSLGLTYAYKHALEHVEKASQILRKAAPALGAVVDLQLIWLYLQNRDVEKADRLLIDAAKSLARTNDVFNQAYVNFLQGRSLRFKGKYAEAAKAFRQSCELYMTDAKYRDGKPHRNIVRALGNAAKSLRLLALKEPADAQRLRDEADKLLREADSYATTMRGVKLDEKARIRIEHAYLLLDRGNKRAAVKSAKALVSECLSHKLEDNVVWCRIHLLEFRLAYRSIATEYVDEADLGHALRCARKAVNRAKATDHRRITARAYIAQSLAEAMLNNTNVAERLQESAGDELTAYDQDYVRDELTELAGVLQSRRKANAKPAVLQYNISELLKEENTKLEHFIKTRVKPDLIVAIRPFYKSTEKMKKAIGLHGDTIREALEQDEARKRKLGIL